MKRFNLRIEPKKEIIDLKREVKIIKWMAVVAIAGIAYLIIKGFFI